MNIELTDKASGAKFIVCLSTVRLIEAASGGGTHIVFDSSMGRIAVEDYGAIKALIGCTTP